MNLNEYANKLREYERRISDKDNILGSVILPNAIELQADIMDRIQQRGEDSNENKMPGYSTDRMYASEEQFVKKSAFKPQEGRKTMRLDKGYKEFRDIQGRQTNYRDLTLSGAMFRSFKTEKMSGKVVIGFDDDTQRKKREGNEDKVGGSVFAGSNNEIKAYSDRVTKKISNITVIID